MRAYDYLAVCDLAQSATVLRRYSNRGVTLLWKGGIVEDQYAPFRAPLTQTPNPCSVQLKWVPLSIGQKMLEALGRGAGHRRSDGLAVLGPKSVSNPVM